MTRAEFRAAVVALRIDPRSFTLDRDETETYVLRRRGTAWRVHYSERGQEGSPADFADEGAALDHLLDLLRRDGTTRLPG